MSMQFQRNKVINSIKDEVELYCDSRVWSKDWLDVLCWLSNFKDNDEHYYFAHLLLDKIIFRTNKMLENSYRRFLATTVRMRVNSLANTQFSVSQFFAALKEADRRLLPFFRVVPILNSHEMAESGSALLRHINQELVNVKFNLQNEANRCPKEKLHSEHLILVVDDFLGSGQQAIDFFKEYSLLHPEAKFLQNHTNLLFAPSLAMSSGQKEFETACPNIVISPLELVLPQHNVFYGDMGSPFNDRDRGFSKQNALDCYNNIKRIHKIGLSDWRGRSESALPIVFQLGVPNQSLGIIFHQASNWHTLQSRRSS